jgi:putative phosphonate metabolism protein
MRYAVYFTPPPEDALTQAAAQWLGRDAFSGETIEPVLEGDLTADDWRALVAAPVRYGFHATLKAPFELSADRSEEELVAAFDSFTSSTPATAIPELTLSKLGRFFALTPGEDSRGIDHLAAQIVEAFEPFRAPMTAEDRARRHPERMSELQRNNLDRWGYHHVFDDFRFHMTLTGQVEPERQAHVENLLRPRFAAFTGRERAISHLGLFVEPEKGGPFTVLKLAALQ